MKLRLCVGKAFAETKPNIPWSGERVELELESFSSSLSILPGYSLIQWGALTRDPENHFILHDPHARKRKGKALASYPLFFFHWDVLLPRRVRGSGRLFSLGGPALWPFIT